MASSAGATSGDRGASPFLSVRLPSGDEYIVSLTGGDVTVGKSEKNVVVDLASRNGVFVNHHRIAGSCLLRNGDIVQVGHCRILLTTKPPGAAKPKKADKSASKSKKKNVATRATWIKVSGAVIAKVIGPLVTLLLGLLISGHFIASCGRHDDDGAPRPAEQRVAREADSAARSQHPAAEPLPR